MTRPVAYRCLQHDQVKFHRKTEIVLIPTINWWHNLRCSNPTESKKKDREHECFRGIVLPVPGSFPLQNDPLSNFDSGSYKPRFPTTRRVKAPPNASSPRSAISGKGLAVVGSFGCAAGAGAGAAATCATSAGGGGVTT